MSKTSLTIVLVVILGAGAVAAAVPPPPNADPYGLAAYYRHHELAFMDERATLADASDGAVLLTLMGVAYDLRVEPASWSTIERVVVEHADGTREVLPLEFPSRAFTGFVAGVEGSRALLSLTEGGVAGFVDAGGRHVGFSPVVAQDKRAPEGVSVVYLQQDVLTPEGWDDHPIPSVPAGPLGEAPMGDIGVLSHEPGPDRTIKLKADSDMVTGTSYVTRISNGYNTMNANFQAMAGFDFILKDNSIFSCADETCDDSWG